MILRAQVGSQELSGLPGIIGIPRNFRDSPDLSKMMSGSSRTFPGCLFQDIIMQIKKQCQRHQNLNPEPPDSEANILTTELS